ncbi:60S ribosomal protein L11 [Bienertia sinuspersici]
MDVDQCGKLCQSIDHVAELSSDGFQVSESPETYKELGSKDQIGYDDVVNFDTTSLIAIISGISNGGAEKLLARSENELKQHFKNNTKFVISQEIF